MTPVTIGDQKFIKDPNKGWIDSKTKQPADKGLIRLLDSLVIDEPVLNKLRTKIDRSVEPVSINGQKFVYDVNHGWVDEKTKTPVPPALQTILNNAVGSQPKVPDVASSMGIAGKAGLQKTKTKTPSQKPSDGKLIYDNDNDTINKPLVRMINTLASIDSVLKQKLENDKTIERNNSLNARESQIEGEEPQIEVIQPDAERVTGSGMGLLAAGGIAALLLFPPVQDAIKEIVDGVVGVGNFVTGIAKSINSAFNFLFGGTVPGEATPSESEPSDTPTASPTTSAEAPASVSAPTQQSATPESQQSSPSMIAGAPATAGESTPALNPVASTTGGTARASNTAGSKTSPQATPMTTRGSTGSTPQASPVTSTPSTTTTGSSSTRPDARSTATATPAPTNGIPINDTNDSASIVRLGRYLQTQGINVSENSAFGSVGEHSNNSRHYSDKAIDLNIVSGRDADNPAAAAKFDALKPQLEAAGYSVLWRTAGHYDHMHVSVGGPEGGGSGYYQTGASSLGSAMSNAANMSLEAVGKLFGILGSAIVKPGIPRTDLGAVIANAAIKTNAAVATKRTPGLTPPQPTLPSTAASTPNINRGGSGPTQNVTTTEDRNSVYYYLRRFGYQSLIRPENVLNMGTLT